MDCSPPGFSVHGTYQARILKWFAISFSRGYSQPRDKTCIPSLAGRFFTTEPPGKPLHIYIHLYTYIFVYTNSSVLSFFLFLSRERHRTYLLIMRNMTTEFTRCRAAFSIPEGRPTYEDCLLPERFFLK